MLVYAPGQFFASHQDSERTDDMVGSLVVELPCRHEGGAFVVQHHQEKKVFLGAPRAPKDLSLLAFYADCHHEVKPVTEGYRITLTYHLIYRGAAKDRPALPLQAIARLAASVAAYFATPVALEHSKSAPQRPERLIYLLDHEYTQSSLGWSHLKNADGPRVGALRQVAERLDCETYLALADVHECWSCEEDDWGGRHRRRGWGRHDEDAKEDGTPKEHELIDLIEDDIELRHWVGPDGRTAPGISATPSGDEIGFTRPSVEMDPFKSEHEGYMGNYGNTLERWYHRAALVMWPRERNFVVRAKVSPSWAVKEIAARLAAGALDEARDKARQLLPLWSWSAPREGSATFVQRLLTVLGSLDDADLALGLLSPLGPHRLSPLTTPDFVALVERHGLSWGQKVFSAWAEDAPYQAPPWRPLLPRLGEALVAGGEHGRALAPWLLTREAASFEQSHAGALGLAEAYREESISRSLDDLLALLETAAVIGAPEVRDDLLAFLMAPATALPLLAAGALLQKCREAHAPAEVRALGLSALYGHVVTSLERVLSAKARSPDDRSIEPPSGCACARCRQLAAFLVDPAWIQHGWPLAKEGRQHIHNVIDRHALPVAHVTARSGSPQTLVLTKQEALFERAAVLRAEQKARLAWLKKQHRAFGEVGPA